MVSDGGGPGREGRGSTGQHAYLLNGRRRRSHYALVYPTTEDRKEYAPVKMQFDQDFTKRRNVIFECARFNVPPDERETVDTIIALYSLTEHCDCGTLHNEMIRD